MLCVVGDFPLLKFDFGASVDRRIENGPFAAFILPFQKIVLSFVFLFSLLSFLFSFCFYLIFRTLQGKNRRSMWRASVDKEGYRRLHFFSFFLF